MAQESPTKLPSYPKIEVTRLDCLPQMTQARDLIRNCMNSKQHTLILHHLKVLLYIISLYIKYYKIASDRFHLEQGNRIFFPSF